MQQPAAVTEAMLQCLVDLDIDRARRVDAHVFAHFGPIDDASLLIVLHMARTGCDRIKNKQRCYSHSWLLERGLRSALPDRLKKLADRLYPRIVSAVGLGVSSSFPEIVTEIRGAMEDVVENVAADGRLEDDAYLKPLILEARDKARKRLGLRMRGGA